jgi:heptaprenyl diphosphate synthase
VPGIKLGITNIVIVLALYCLGTKEAFTISVLRIVLAGFLFGNLFSILYSLAGGLFSLFIMWLLKRTNKVHIVVLSAVGGICHNLGQIIIACLIVENYNVMYYFPVLFLAGVITGIIVGIVAVEVYKRIRKFFVNL